MREIKFRAWDKNEKLMHEVIVIQKNEFIAVPEITGDGWELRKRKITDVDLMQYTGLKDCHGKEIYEGDIVKNNKYECLSEIIFEQNEGSKIGIVKGIFGEENNLNGFIDEIGAFKFKGIGKWKGKTKAHYIGEFEIIGNIYENTDLLTPISHE